MTDIPVKKYRVRRARKWLKNKLLPFSVQAGKVSAKWSKPDRSRFPPRSQVDVPGLARFEYSWLSKNGEDGILRYLFDEIGFESRWLVEFGFCAGQCNALRLMLKEGFHCLLMDGSRDNVAYFKHAAERRGIDRVTAVQEFITLDNLQRLIKDNGVPADIDFLSLDVDGNDYWFWEALDCISPRVVCIEYNAGIGPDLALTVPYDAQFERYSKHASGFYYGASLAALESLGRRKGYYLIGCDSTGTNAFFLRDDIEIEGMMALTAREAFRPHKNWLGRGIAEAAQLEFMRSMPYQEV